MKRMLFVFVMLMCVCLPYTAYHVYGEICTHVSGPCDLEMGLDPGEYCCLSVSSGCVYTEDVTMAYMLPIWGLSCGNLRQSFLLPCALHVGYCGGPQCNTDCQPYGFK